MQKKSLDGISDTDVLSAGKFILFAVAYKRKFYICLLNY